MLPIPTENQNDTIPSTTRRDKRTTATNKVRTVKIAQEAWKLNESCVKKEPNMQNMEELWNQITAELSRNDHDPIWISVIDLDYAYGQMKLAP